MRYSSILNTSGVILLSLVLPSIVYGEEIVSQKEQSPVAVELIESPLRLMSVQTPTFGTYELTHGIQQIQATGDLVIQVEDTRKHDHSSWGIQYEISVFEITSGKRSLRESAQIKIGTGELTIGKATVDSSMYNAQSVELASEKSGLLIHINNSQANHFSYRVAKEHISISLPKQTEPGEYSAIQTITLVNLPMVNE